MMQKIKRHPDIDKAGMILCHNGIVRRTERDGKHTKGLRVFVDHEKLKQLILKQKNKPGIIEILVHIIEEQDLLTIVDGDKGLVCVLDGTLEDGQFVEVLFIHSRSGPPAGRTHFKIFDI